MAEGKIAIIIPNWNGIKYLPECLESLQKQSYDNFEVIVIDNGSEDGSQELVTSKYPELVLCQNRENLGFAAACNIGIKIGLERGAEFILLLNNDTIADEMMLKYMLEAMADKDTGIVGGKIYYYDSPEKIWYAGGKMINWRASGKHLFWQKNDTKDLKGIKETGFVTGCLMLIRKEVFFNSGFFYESYFLTVEDLDFCYRAKKGGWKIKVSLDARLWHRVSSSRQGEFSFSNGYYGTRNRLIFAFKRARLYHAGIFILLVIFPVRLIQWGMDKSRREMLRGMVQGIKDFFKNKNGKF